MTFTLPPDMKFGQPQVGFDLFSVSDFNGLPLIH
jgi:hypothetical protein